MSQRKSGYERIAGDVYETPSWVTRALLPHIPLRVESIWEPAAGSGKMVRVLKNDGFEVTASDITRGQDFLKVDGYPGEALIDAIITNPPYTHAEEFINRALFFTVSHSGIVAMLLRTDYDHAKTRQYLFGDANCFAKKIVLTKRIRWIEGSTGSPSFNHAWYIWDWKNQGAPELRYHYEE